MLHRKLHGARSTPHSSVWPVGGLQRVSTEAGVEWNSAEPTRSGAGVPRLRTLAVGRPRVALVVVGDRGGRAQVDVGLHGRGALASHDLQVELAGPASGALGEVQRVRAAGVDHVIAELIGAPLLRRTGR